MNNKLLVAAALVASFGYVSAADAQPGSKEQMGWFQTVRSVPSPFAVYDAAGRRPVIEGRNATTYRSPDQSEAYIRRSIEQQRRSSR